MRRQTGEALLARHLHGHGASKDVYTYHCNLCSKTFLRAATTGGGVCKSYFLHRPTLKKGLGLLWAEKKEM